MGYYRKEKYFNRHKYKFSVLCTLLKKWKPCNRDPFAKFYAYLTLVNVLMHKKSILNRDLTLPLLKYFLGCVSANPVFLS